MIRTKEVKSLRGIEGLGGEWDALLRTCPVPSVYISHAWLSAWWRHFGEPLTPCLLLFYDGAALVGAAPLARSRTTINGLPIRQLGFAINGCSQEGDFLFPAGRQAELCEALCGHLRSTAGEWDTVCLDGLEIRSGILPVLTSAAAKAGLWTSRPTTWESLVIPVSGDYESYLKGRSRKFRKGMREQETRLQRLGEVNYRRHVTAGEIREGIVTFGEIEKRSWKYTEGDAITRRENAMAFYQDVASAFATEDGFRLFTIEVNGRAIAGEFGLTFGATAYALKICYDQEFAAVSPGRLVQNFFTRDYWESGCSEIDLDRPTGFSDHWTEHSVSHAKIWIFNRRPVSSLLFALRKGRDILRLMRHRWMAERAASPEEP